MLSQCHAANTLSPCAVLQAILVDCCPLTQLHAVEKRTGRTGTTVAAVHPAAAAAAGSLRLLRCPLAPAGAGPMLLLPMRRTISCASAANAGLPDAGTPLMGAIPPAHGTCACKITKLHCSGESEHFITGLVAKLMLCQVLLHQWGCQRILSAQLVGSDIFLSFSLLKQTAATSSIGLDWENQCQHTKRTRCVLAGGAPLASGTAAACSRAGALERTVLRAQAVANAQSVLPCAALFSQAVAVAGALVLKDCGDLEEATAF